MTIKQKKAYAKIVENGGNISKAMRDVGYSPETAKSPSKLTESKGWKELMDKYLPDDEVLEVHKKALHATKIHGSMTEPDRIVEDIPTQLKAVELSYKVKGKMASVGDINISGDKVIAILGNIKPE